MIAPLEIKSYFDQQLPLIEALKFAVDPLLKDISKKYDGIYIPDIKQIESLTQKIESGDFKNISVIIDLFRATIVVPTKAEIEAVKMDLLKDFVITRTNEKKQKSPSEFKYDDIHLHLKYSPKIKIPGREHLERPFELQVKTFLQHAWTKATHDIIYKGQEFSWPSYRVAHQIKAMLEQSDDILMKLEEKSSFCDDNEYNDFREKNRIIALLSKYWEIILLPSDKIKLAENIFQLLGLGDRKVDFLQEELSKKENGLFISSKSITPYQAILGILIKTSLISLVENLSKSNKKIFITSSLSDLIGVLPKELTPYKISLEH